MYDNMCLIIIDVQKGIFKLKQPVYNKERFIGNLKALINSAKNNNVRIVYTQHENGTFLLRDSEDWKIIDDITPIDEDRSVVFKKHPSIFKDTDLLNILHRYKIETLYIAGLISNGCIKHACLEGLKHGFNTVLVSDAHSTFYKNADKIIEKINKEMNSRGVTVTKSIELW